MGAEPEMRKQSRRGKETTPKGRTRRTVPMTDTLLAALKSLDTIRTGFVVRTTDGEAMNDNETKYHCYRICRAAGLPEHGWHTLRHSFRSHDDPDRKVIAMLDARRHCLPIPAGTSNAAAGEGRGKPVAKPKTITDENRMILVR